MVKEHRLLMMAMESDDALEIISAVKQIINNCLLDKIDVDTLPTVDIELLFTHLRAKSIGETVDMRYKCTNEIEGVPCGKPFSITINLLEDVQIKNDKFETKIELSDKVGMIMRLPSLAFSSSAESNTPDDLDLIVECIECIYDADGVYNSKDATKEELIEFIENMNEIQYTKVSDFFNNTPYIFTEKSHTCTKCGYEHNMRLEGIADFFM